MLFYCFLFMKVNDFNNDNVHIAVFTKEITIEDNGDNSTMYVFPDTRQFISRIQHRKNSEKLHNILKRK